MEWLRVKKIEKKGNRINFQHDGSSGITQFMREQMFCEYDENIEGVSDSIAVIPFLANVLPFVWIMDAVVEVDEIDKDFFECLDAVRDGYRGMYPMLSWGGHLKANYIVDNNNQNVVKGTAAQLFSGGVDAYTTMFRHLDEKPDLITVWGADIKLKDIQGWERVSGHTKKVAEKYNLRARFIRSNFKSFLNTKKLGNIIEKSGGSWWADFQHGIGLLGLCAPFSGDYRFLLIASSFSEEERGEYICASDPTIDNCFQCNGLKVIHDGYEMDRQGKVRLLVEKKNEGSDIDLRVCWESAGGRNCCRCEKCYRTILEIVSEGGDPNKMGFCWSQRDINCCRTGILYRDRIPKDSVLYFQKIQISMRMKQHDGELGPEYEWFLDIDFDHINDSFVKRVYNSSAVRHIRHIPKHFKEFAEFLRGR